MRGDTYRTTISFQIELKLVGRISFVRWKFSRMISDIVQSLLFFKKQICQKPFDMNKGWSERSALCPDMRAVLFILRLEF